jgi:hypothetical protein
LINESSRGFDRVSFNWNDYDPNLGGQCTSIKEYQIEYKAANRGEAFRDGGTFFGSTASISGL